MEARKKIFIIISIVVLFLLALILLFLFLRKPAATPSENTTVTSTPKVSGEDVVAPPKNIPPPPPKNTEERERLYVKQLSRTFVERFETKSNQNGNRNIVDASELATENMASYIASKAQAPAADYQGFTTKVISMDLTAFTLQAATVKVGAQIESSTATSSQTLYKNGRVELKKVDGTWKVDGLFWDAQ